MWLIGGLLLPAWLSMMAQIIPIRIRGRFFAWSGVLGASLGLGASAGGGLRTRQFSLSFWLRNLPGRRFGSLVDRVVVLPASTRTRGSH